MTNGSQVKATRNWWRIAGWGTAVALILTPLVAMQFTSDVHWTPADFIFAIVVFGSVGLGLEIAARRKNGAYTAGAGIALLVCLMTVWFTGAVGIIGNENEDSNMLFLGVVLIALLGSTLAAFRPPGMAVAMIAAAVAQLAVPPLAALVSDSSMDAIWARHVIVLTIAFTAMWLVAARLFRIAAQRA